jgi:hypothetical protein
MAQDKLDIRYDKDAVNPFVALILAQRLEQTRGRELYVQHNGKLFDVERLTDEFGSWTNITVLNVEELSESEVKEILDKSIG